MNLLHLSVLTILLGLLPGTFAVKSTEPKANSLLHLIGQVCCSSLRSLVCCHVEIIQKRGIHFI